DDDFPDDDAPGIPEEPPGLSVATWQAPTAPGTTAVAEKPAAPPDAAPLAPPGKRRRWTLAAIGGMVLVLACFGMAGWWVVESGRAASEGQRAAKAMELYEPPEQNFAEAAARFQELLRDFPDSRDAKKYRFMAELSDVRSAVY